MSPNGSHPVALQYQSCVKLVYFICLFTLDVCFYVFFLFFSILNNYLCMSLCASSTISIIIIITRNSSGDENEIAKRDFSVYLFIFQLYINSCIINK